ncbi:hypothetical protein AB0I10_12795 [Streptomyces sp. NPDC050636]|uniref:hypothetical protein n=1 Tax=Streptomyces sp. NPDC050636 TaxID=3154510 RepID=UPI003416E7D7
MKPVLRSAVGAGAAILTLLAVSGPATAAARGASGARPAAPVSIDMVSSDPIVLGPGRTVDVRGSVCPDGTRVVGGGTEVYASEGDSTRGYPDQDLNQWVGSVSNHGTVPVEVTGYSACLGSA